MHLFFVDDPELANEAAGSQVEEAVKDTITQADKVLDTAKELVTSPEKVSDVMNQIIGIGIEVGKSILAAVLIYIVGRFFIKMVKKVLDKVLNSKNVDPTLKSFLQSMVTIVLNILLGITILGTLGIETTSFAALLASVGVAVGMALSGNLQNFAGGIMILLFKPYKVGDYIEAQGVQGTVKGIQIFHTIMLTVDNKEIYVPNGALSSGTMTNYSKNPLRRVDWNFGVEYGQDINKVRTVIANILAADERVLKDPASQILLSELSDSAVIINVRAWVDSANYWDVLFSINETVYNEFNKQGISFPFPQLTVHQG